MTINEILIEKMRDCLRYAIDRLTDADLDGCPDDLRYKWVNDAAEKLFLGNPPELNP